MEKSGVNLSSYVEEVCLEILRGVSSAQENEGLGKYVGRNPNNPEYSDESDNSVTYVEFSVSAEVVTSKKGKGEIKVFSVGSADGQIEKSNALANKVSFKIPLAIPSPKDQQNVKAERRRENDSILAASRLSNNYRNS